MRNYIGYFLNKAGTFAAAAVAALIFYYLTRTAFFFLAEYSWKDRIFGGLLLAGETYIIVHTLGFLAGILKVKTKCYTHDPARDVCTLQSPPVAVLVAARHEPKEVLEDTLTALISLDYPDKNIYLLDDSSDERYIKEAAALGEEFGVKVFRREKRHGAKAGIINDFIKNMTEKYLAIFDADQNPMPGFLRKIVYLLERDEKLAFVQTPQFYTNTQVSPIAAAAAIQQAIFYEAICEAKGSDNAMFCCGTNVVFRKSALEEVGGFDESSITEDFATSVRLHAAGYRSLYYNKVSAFGMAPESLPAYFQQQNRWASGTISVFNKIVRMFIRSAGSLTPWQWWEYFMASTYYFVGWAFFLLMISPVAFLLFGVPSFFMDPIFYIGVFAPYYVLSIIIFYTSMIDRNYVFAGIYRGTILGMLSFPVLMRAAVYGLLNKKMPFGITAKGKVDKMPFFSLWPYHVMIGLNVAALAAGFYKFHTGLEYAVWVNMFWAAYHIFILAHIYYFNKEPVLTGK